LVFESPLLLCHRSVHGNEQCEANAAEIDEVMGDSVTNFANEAAAEVVCKLYLPNCVCSFGLVGMVMRSYCVKGNTIRACKFQEA